MLATHAIHLRSERDPHFRIPPLLKDVYTYCSKVSPPTSNDRYFKPEYEILLEYIKNELPTFVNVINPTA